MKKIIVISTFLFVLTLNTYAHKEWVHQYLVQQAYYMLKSTNGINPAVYCKEDFGIDFWGSAPRNFFGSGDNSNPWFTKAPIDVGVWREDMEDIVYNFGNNGNCIEASLTHFWNADHGVNSTLGLLTCIPSMQAPNAWTKAKAILFNNNAFPLTLKKDTVLTLSGVLLGNAITQQFVIHEWEISYQTIFDVYQNNFTVRPKFSSTQLALINAMNATVPGSIPNSNSITWVNSGRNVALQLLGHVAHLLSDMSVPAHTRNVLHPCMLSEGDYYELEMGGSLTASDCSAAPNFNSPLNCVATAVDAQTALLQGDLLNNIMCMNDEAAIFYLFYTTNQIANFFPSGAENPTAHYYTAATIKHAGNTVLDPMVGTFPEINSVFNQFNAIPPSTINVNQIAQYTFNYAIRACATLFNWFQIRLQQYPGYTHLQNLQTGNSNSILNNASVNNGGVFITGNSIDCYARNKIVSGNSITNQLVNGPVIIQSGDTSNWYIGNQGYIQLLNGFHANTGCLFKTHQVHFPCATYNTARQFAPSSALQINADTLRSPTIQTVHVYPNPATDLFEVELSVTSAQKISLNLYNELGIKVQCIANELAVSNGINMFTIHRENLPNGIYFLNYKSASGQQSFKVIFR